MPKSYERVELHDMLDGMPDGINPTSDLIDMLPIENQEAFLDDPSNQFNGHTRSVDTTGLLLRESAEELAINPVPQAIVDRRSKIEKL